jgi:hypothetical protein
VHADYKITSQIQALDAQLRNRQQHISRLFDNNGHKMQKSLEGLLQTLLYHILDACPEYVAVLCPERSSEKLETAVSSQPWILTELQKSFAIFWELSTVVVSFYFHVDSLDEHQGDSWDVIDTLEELATCYNVKLCVSSLP